MPIQMTFASSSTAAISVPVGLPPGTVLALPAVDSLNVGARITNNSPTRAVVNIGTGSFLPAPAKGCLLIPPNSVVLVPTAAGAATGMGVAVDGYASASLVFERGTITTTTVYGPADLAVVA